jgi:hypothetical protein
VQAAGFSMSSCQPSCGDFSLKYPFGIGVGCYADDWFEVVCHNDSLASPSPKPFLRILNLEVLSISLAGTVHVHFPTVYNCTNGTKQHNKQYCGVTKQPFHLLPIRKQIHHHGLQQLCFNGVRKWVWSRIFVGACPFVTRLK